MKLKNLKLPFKIKNKVLALGGQTKNTICFVKGNTAFLTPIHPDLNSPEDCLDFEKGVKYFLKKIPTIIAYDLHSEYQSTKYALSTLNTKQYQLKAIQHHHAHIASCMADNGLQTNEAKEKIAYRFHLTIAEMIRKMCLVLRKDTSINKVVLSGGVFQNNLLLRLSLELLYKQGFKVSIHKNLPCNDSAISMGQAIIANRS